MNEVSAKGAPPQRRALVLGGTGYVGREVVRALVREGVRVCFSYCHNRSFAEELSQETGAAFYEADFLRGASVSALFEQLDADGCVADILVHAAVLSSHGPLSSISDEQEAAMYAVNVRSVRTSLACFEARLGKTGADVVLLAALDGIAKIAANASFAATQAARLGMTYALAKELGPKDIRVNLVLLGALSGGIAADLEPSRLADYRRYSAMQRTGEALEIGRAVRQLVLSNRWMTGSVLPVTGGL